MSTPPGFIPNPTGKGGFVDHPENIQSGGRWKYEDSQNYWLHKFQRMTIEELKEWDKQNDKSKRTVAGALAFKRTMEAIKDLKTYEVVINRTEGTPKQSVDVTSGDEKIVGFNFVVPEQK